MVLWPACRICRACIIGTLCIVGVLYIVYLVFPKVTGMNLNIVMNPEEKRVILHKLFFP
jgi:hypothetical protein